MLFFFFQAEDGIRDAQESCGLGDVYKRQQWISAKKYRRNNLNQLLYWLSPIPGPGNDQMVTEMDPLWNPNLLVVTDTLSTVAYDGDC